MVLVLVFAHAQSTRRVSNWEEELLGLVLVLVLVVVRAFNRLSEIHTARSEPALGYDCDVRSSAQTPPWGGEYQVGSSGASGRGSEERELNLPRRHLRIAARASRTPSTANRISLRNNCRGFCVLLVLVFAHAQSTSECQIREEELLGYFGPSVFGAAAPTAGCSWPQAPLWCPEF